MPSREAELERRVARSTLAPPSGGPPPRRVLVVPPGEELTAAFEEAQRLLAEGPLRLVGHGVTTSAARPSWSEDAPGLWLTELGAYKVQPAVLATAGLRDALAAWIDDILPPIGQRQASRVLRQSAAARFFQRRLDAHVLADGIRRLHADDDVRIHGTSDAYPELRQKTPSWREELVRRAWPLAVFGAATAFQVAAIGDTARIFVRARPAQRWLETARDPSAKPRVWLALVPNFVRINAHFLESVARPALARGLKVGLILVGHVEPAAEAERDGKSPWGGLGFLGSRLDEVVVEQCVGPETIRQLAHDIVSSTKMTFGATLRLARREPAIVHDGTRYDLIADLPQLARFLTLDVARAVAADHATRRFLARHSVKDLSTVFTASAAASIAPVDAAVQDAGARTFELFHGTGDDYWHGSAESASQVRFVWSELDRELHRGVLHGVRVGGMPHVPERPPPGRQARRILVMTNFVHRDFARMRFPQRPFQRELMRAVGAAAEAAPHLDFRWRPHPADVEPILLADRPSARVELSRGKPLHEDLFWADVVITSQSTSLVEALVMGLPVIGYVLPGGDEGAVFLHPTRRFSKGEELLGRLEECIRELETTEERPLAPERFARESLFGEGGIPAPFPFEVVG